MLTSIGCLAISLMMAFGCSCSDWQLPPQPLTEVEKREILHRLVEVESLRHEVAIYKAYIQREAELARKEAANSEEAIRLAGEATKLAQREKEIERMRADFYQHAYEALSKGRSKKCWFFKIISLGLARCK